MRTVIRHASALILAFSLCHTTVSAQTMQLTVAAAAAEVRSAPSMVNPVIGRAPRGALLDITRDVGDWYKISWPGAKDGVGYVRRSELTAAPGTAGTSTSITSRTSPQPSGAAPVSEEKMAVLADLNAERQPSALRTSTITAPSHALGLGGLMGGPMRAPAFGVGLTGRAWPSRRVGLQVAVARHSLTSASAAGRVTSTSIAPSLLVGLPEHLSDFVWLRPYVGTGGRLDRSTLSGVTPGVTASERAFGIHAFGGAELTLASAPRLALSADLGYQRIRTTFAGFDPAGLNISFAAHWYLR